MMSDNVKNEKVKFEVLSGVVGQETKLQKVYGMASVHVHCGTVLGTVLSYGL